MSESLTSTLPRVRRLLKDASSLNWSDDDLSECLHQALDDLNQSSGQTWSLEGLGAAVTTTLPDGLTSLLARGAAAYALFVLAASRADLFNFQPGVCQATTAAGTAFLKQFHCGLSFLAQVRVSGLQASLDAPFPSAADETQSGWRLDGDLR